ncbi:MAG: elongation factor G [Deltaproteobacteria bacterium]|nr:elongation factor G [Deltaproteobacteria bacterium]MBW2050849.1 elongation factor G [Deltaproteobacteria bacterium]MBW2140169.1 elongation factor G [Deltaproteobacteria bacterium]MBW2322308.1 elongation factor G [Deltaproteobacteria bacterium]
MEDITQVRNIALISHGGAGKTTLAEAFLYFTKVTTRLGRPDEGTSILDFEPEEIKRRASLSSAFHNFSWKKRVVSFVDTPGDENFINDTMTCLQGVDGALVLIDAVDGIKIGTERVWGFADNRELPRIVFINKMDRERADFFKIVNELSDLFDMKCVPVQVPIGAEHDFKGLVNLLDEKAYIYEANTAEFKQGDIPEDLAETVQTWREQLIENIAETDDELLEKYLDAGELTDEEINQGLVNGVKSRSLAPICCGAGSSLIGISHLLDLVVSALPSPQDRGSVKGFSPKDNSEIAREPKEDESFSGLVIKTITDPYAGQLSVFRVFSGTITHDSTFYNSSSQKVERFSQLLSLEGKSQKPVESAGPGDIVAVAKLKGTTTGNTICDESEPIIYPTLDPMPPIVSYAVSPKTKGDEEKVFSSLSKIIEEDVTLKLSRDDQTKEVILSGMGQIHIEVTLERIKRKFGVEVQLNTPKVPYKETVKGKARVQGKYKKQTGGRGQYGDTWLEIEPLPRGMGFEFQNKIVGGAIPKQFIPAVEKGIVEAMAGGVITGNPIVDLRVKLVDGSFHAVDSSEIAFKIAGSMGFKKGFLESSPTLLEPIMLLTVNVPDEYMGDVIGDLNSRRGKVQGVDTKGGKQYIRAQVPQADVMDYAPTLKSITGARGSFTIEFDHYEEVPPHIYEKIVAETAKDSEG